jgi:hypothetical protein
MVHSIPSALGIFKARNSNSASHGPHSWKIWFLLIDLLTELNPVQNAHHRFVQIVHPCSEIFHYFEQLRA